MLAVAEGVERSSSNQNVGGLIAVFPLSMLKCLGQDTVLPIDALCVYVNGNKLYCKALEWSSRLEKRYIKYKPLTNTFLLYNTFISV